MKRLFLMLCVGGLSLCTFAQQDEVLLTIDGKPVMASEFEYIYTKNSQETMVEPKTIDEYLQLFINFKLKVTEAEKAGLDTTAAFARELKGYRAQAIPKYMQDKEAMDSLVQLSYDRMRYDRRAAHIAVECPMDAPDSLQQAVKAQLESVRQRVFAGEDFAALAVEISTIPSAKDDKGELGWITPFRYVYAFEDAVYSTPVGQVTPVFRSPYGFHIALVEEELLHEEVHAAHIMKMVPGADSAKNIIAKQQIDSIYQLLSAGGSFEQLASAESDDKGSAMRGGDLGWFGRGVMVRPFEDKVFSLKEGEVSEPFNSRFGWHIALVKGHRATLPLDSIRSQVEKSVQRDERSKEADKSFIRKARKEYNLSDDMTDADVREYVDNHLEEKYEELRHLVQEYHDGILLFDVSLDRVWDKASKDEEGLTAYFEAHKEKYTWDKPRWKGFVIYAKDQAHARVAQSIIRTLDADSVQSYINTRVNNDSVKFVTIERGVWQQGQNKAVDQYGFKVKGAKYENTAMPVVVLAGKKQKAPQEYKDERGNVTSDYQDELEKQWVEELRAKYDVQVNQEVFDKLR
ncbi:MAG: peptidylprolyl isomerase [Paludibacteraceae bacterium]|nr:peptidylprolyl isomerase [Paludibacteraceae bacterium]